MTIFRLAERKDVDALVALQVASHISNVDGDCQKQGFLNTVLPAECLEKAMDSEKAVYVAEQSGEVVAMAVCASWDFWAFSPSLSNVATELPKLTPEQSLNEHTSVFWGPVCVAQHCRGQGIFERLFAYVLREQINKKPFIFTYVHEDNEVSLTVHQKKCRMLSGTALNINGQAFRSLYIAI
ncbi:GNAT family N-acetyltransferase [Enterovibrio coralii]|uniref:N-acetyltransferase domain-containing protein n=1 Tax=Enterovibrio coralii TaxID=294935 RepID=A0A135I696_9GAMM|nr:GNAT family N-acetyltransferase [Enterovibrio coralii]KXF80971.1 hypothetical protein ATN88_18155 [Enterovibrio coralii]